MGNLKKTSQKISIHQLLDIHLDNCPFCNGNAYIGVYDDEGNPRDLAYMEDPWSGLTFAVCHDHEDNDDCPIALYKCDGAHMGVYRWDTPQDAADHWNRRKHG